jgi:hypothetical protein
VSVGTRQHCIKERIQNQVHEYLHNYFTPEEWCAIRNTSLDMSSKLRTISKRCCALRLKRPSEATFAHIAGIALLGSHAGSPATFQLNAHEVALLPALRIRSTALFTIASRFVVQARVCRFRRVRSLTGWRLQGKTWRPTNPKNSSLDSECGGNPPKCNVSNPQGLGTIIGGLGYCAGFEMHFEA